MNSYYSKEELISLNFKTLGEQVSISRYARFYGVSQISIGNNVRIDDFAVLSAGKGGIQIGNYVHLAVFSLLQGEGLIVLEDFVGLSSRVSIYSSNDDYFGEFMTNPTIPACYTGVTHADVMIRKHVIIGSGSVVLPGVVIATGAAVGAMSLVTGNCEEFWVYSGNPAKKLLRRSRKLLKREQAFLQIPNDE